MNACYGVSTAHVQVNRRVWTSTCIWVPARYSIDGTQLLRKKQAPHTHAAMCACSAVHVCRARSRGLEPFRKVRHCLSTFCRKGTEVTRTRDEDVSSLERGCITAPIRTGTSLLVHVNSKAPTFNFQRIILLAFEMCTRRRRCTNVNVGTAAAPSALPPSPSHFFLPHISGITSSRLHPCRFP